MEELIVKEAEQAKESTKKLVLKYAEYRILSAEQYLISADDLQVVKGKWKEIEAKRKGITDPMNKALDETNALFKTPLALLKGLELQIKNEIDSFRARQEQAKREEERKLMERAAKAEAKGKEEKAETLKMQAAAVSLAEVAPKVSGLSFTDSWYCVIDKESDVPRNFLKVDTDKLDDFAKATKGTMPVAGVRFLCKQITRSRSK